MKKNDKVVMICHGHDVVPFLSKGVVMDDEGCCIAVDWGEMETGYEMDGHNFYCIAEDRLGLLVDKLEVGDKVRCISKEIPHETPDFKYLGEVVKATSYDALVKFKGWTGGHDGATEFGSHEYWWISYNELVKVNDNQDYGDYFQTSTAPKKKVHDEWAGPNKYGYKLYDKVIMKKGDDTVPAGTVGFVAGDVDSDEPCVVWEYKTGYSYTNANNEHYDNLHCVMWDEIEKYEPAKDCVTIKLDGRRTYAIKGNRTVSVCCHSSDTYDEATGMIEAIKKLYNKYTGFAIRNGEVLQFVDGRAHHVDYDDTWTPILCDDDGFNVGTYKAEGFTGFAIYNGHDHAFTKGRPYEIVHGQATDNDGDNRSFFKDDWIKVNPSSEYHFLPF